MNRIVEMKDGGRQYGRQGRRGTISNQFLSRPTTLPVRAQKKKKEREGLTPRVLGHKVQVLTADDNGAVHLGRDDLAGEDASTDRDETRERALLVDVSALDSLTGSLYTRQKKSASPPSQQAEEEQLRRTLKPRPTSLYQRRSLPATLREVVATLALWNSGCFWKDFSTCSAMVLF
jgi:hypothetical protein